MEARTGPAALPSCGAGGAGEPGGGGAEPGPSPPEPSSRESSTPELSPAGRDGVGEGAGSRASSAQAQLGARCASVAHEFRNILTVIQGYAAGPELGPPSAEDRLLFERTVRYGIALCDRIVAAGRSEAAVFDAGRTLYELRPLLARLVAPRCRTAWLIEQDLPALLGDPAALQQLVTKLVCNASEALEPSGGVVRVRVRAHRARDVERDRRAREGESGARVIGEAPGDPAVVVEVVDRGAGMGPEALARLCDPDFSTKGPERGIGMASAESELRANGAALFIETRVAAGTTARIVLPGSPLSEDA